jgi:hypothetical protein
MGKNIWVEFIPAMSPLLTVYAVPPSLVELSNIRPLLDNPNPGCYNKKAPIKGIKEIERDVL